jgi:hypothetical protein
MAVTGSAVFGQSDGTLRVHIDKDPAARMTVILGTQGASARLRRPACRKILEDFPGWPGREIVSQLETSGISLEVYIRSYISFVDGSDNKLCNTDEGTFAFTGLGHKVVHVCPARVINLVKDMTTVELLVIHEILHTLGLPENPPSSAAITDRVRKRCG